MGYIDFTFNGISARDMRIKSVRVEDGIMQFPFATTADLTTVNLPDSVETYMYKSKREPLSIPLQLMLVDERGNNIVWKEKDIYNVADWLIQDGYKPLTLGDSVGKIYYAKLLDSEFLQHYGNGGVLPITFVTNSPYAWSIPQMEQYDLTGETTSNIEFVNKTNVLERFRPVLEIKNINANGTIEIQNITTGEPAIKLKNLYANEIISIDNERELIQTDKPLAMMSGRFNYNWLKLKRGLNIIKVDGSCTITVRYQFPIIT